MTDSDISLIAARKELVQADSVALSRMLDTSHGNCHTFLVGRQPVAIVGASRLWAGVWQVWAIVSNAVRGHGLYFTKGCKIILNSSAVAFKVRRYNAIVGTKDSEYIRWLNTLGFEYEYTMFGASPDGNDIHGYVKWVERKIK